MGIDHCRCTDSFATDCWYTSEGGGGCTGARWNGPSELIGIAAGVVEGSSIGVLARFDCSIVVDFPTTQAQLAIEINSSVVCCFDFNSDDVGDCLCLFGNAGYTATSSFAISGGIAAFEFLGNCNFH